MGFDAVPERWYSFCEEHKDKINTGIGWTSIPIENGETCDYKIKKKIYGGGTMSDNNPNLKENLYGLVCFLTFLVYLFVS